MRIASDPTHPDYHHCYRQCTVYLEGSARTHVISADEELRTATTYRLDANGHVQFDKHGNALTDTFYGHVRIDCPAWLNLEQALGKSTR
jgi:hypothetical protein